MRSGQLPAARDFFRQASAAEPRNHENWLNLALAARALKDHATQLQALEETLALRPRDLMALLLKGMLFEEQGDLRIAAETYANAIKVAPPPEALDKNLRRALDQAKRVHGDYAATRQRAIEAQLMAARGQGQDDARRDRFEEALEVYLGRRKTYTRQPHVLHYPGLPETQFYRRQEFPWLAPIEAATEEILAELRGVLESDEGFSPYIQYPSGIPLDQWAELNHSPRWNAFHFIKSGRRIEENCARCPRTMALLANVPGAALPSRGPNAMFSVLQPKTRIPPHTGVVNTRLVVHIPLIIPEACEYRVGNDTRPWRMGEAFIFDDTIEHEAYNGSDKTRVVLIFDIWHPDLTEGEKFLIQKLFEASDAFSGGPRAEEL